MTDPKLFLTRQGPPRSGEVIITEEEAGKADPYTRVARQFFSQFLELLTQMQDGQLVTPDRQAHAEKEAEKEVRRWRKANEELKRAAQDLAGQVTTLEVEVDRLTTENENLRGQLNEAILRTESMRARHKLPKDEPGHYPLTDLMSERAYQMWREVERTMQAPPTNLKGEDDNA